MGIGVGEAPVRAGVVDCDCGTGIGVGVAAFVGESAVGGSYSIPPGSSSTNRVSQ